MKPFVSHSLAETETFAQEWVAATAAAHEKEAASAAGSGACIAGLSGHLGAGKTAFVKAVARALGVAEEVTSPTFVIMKLYETGPDAQSRTGFRRLAHIDAYRLERREELEALDWEALAADSHALVMVEWPENVGIKPALRMSAGEDAYMIDAVRE